MRTTILFLLFVGMILLLDSAASANPNQVPFLIISPGRAGSAWLSQLLMASTNKRYLMDSEPFNLYSHPEVFDNVGNPDSFFHMIDLLFNEQSREYSAQSRFHFSRAAPFLAQQGEPALSSADALGIRVTYSQVFQLGFMSPEHFVHELSMMMKMDESGFGALQVIHLTRNPLEVALSREVSLLLPNYRGHVESAREAKMLQTDLRLQAMQVERVIQTMSEIGVQQQQFSRAFKKIPHALIEIDYADLERDPNAVLNDIFSSHGFSALPVGHALDLTEADSLMCRAFSHTPLEKRFANVHLLEEELSARGFTSFFETASRPPTRLPPDQCTIDLIELFPDIKHGHTQRLNQGLRRKKIKEEVVRKRETLAKQQLDATRSKREQRRAERLERMRQRKAARAKKARAPHIKQNHPHQEFEYVDGHRIPLDKFPRVSESLSGVARLIVEKRRKEAIQEYIKENYQ